MAASTHSNPTLEAGSWQLLTPPTEKDEKIEVGVVEVHPSLNRVTYATRARNDQSQDIGKTRIVIHDFDQNSSNNGNVVAMFTLRELSKRINEFRTKSNVSMMAASAHSTQSRDMLHSLSSATSPSIMPYTVQMLGAVQNISFLSRDAIRCQVPPVREEPSRMQRLMIGFRRCVVVVHVFHLKDQKEKSYARGVQVMAYIGPDDLDEYEHDEKAKKRQPSSFPIPISENILAYGCYDGGIRFYDVVRRKQAKSALGPNGRNNAIVRVINANRTQSDSTSPPREVKNRRSSGCETILPRIISVCATGVAYLWELDLSIDLDSGEVLYFDIPPPLVSFDGLVAAVSGKGVPVKYPPTLSPTSIASLSPCSSWEQTDEVNSQFDVSFDPHRNVLCWVFSPDCIGSSSSPHASREERLNMNGVLVCWEVTNLPRQEWPPPILPPNCVVQLPRTEEGRVSAEMVIPSIHGVLSYSHFVTIYVTSSNEFMASVTDLENHGDSVQLNSSVMNLSDLRTFNYQSGYACFTVAVSSQLPLIAMGTQHGILFTEISTKLNEVKKQLFPIQEENENQNSSPSIVRRFNILARVDDSGLELGRTIANSDLESKNKDLECQLDGMKQEANKAFTEEERNELQSRVKEILEEHAKFCEMSETDIDTALSNVESHLLIELLKMKNESCQDLQTEVETLKGNLDHINEELEQEKRINQETTMKLSAVEDRAGSLEKEAKSRNDLITSVHEECDNLWNLEDIGRGERDSRLTIGDFYTTTNTAGKLQKELSTAKQTEESLRNYIALLEEDKVAMDKELEDARRQTKKCAEKYDRLTANLRSDVKEQKMAIDSLVDLLERQRIDHAKETENQHGEIASLKKQLSEMQVNHQTEMDEMNKSNKETIDKLKAECSVLKADASMGNEIFLAMKVELQNALNELAEYQHEQKEQR